MSTEIIRVKKAGLKEVRKIRSHVVVGYSLTLGKLAWGLYTEET
jgi:hypothetical protein